MSAIKLYYRLTIKDKKGKVVKRTRLRKSHSFVRAFLQMLESLGFAEDIPNVFDIGNVNRTLDVSTMAPASGDSIYMKGADDDDQFGPVVGTGSGAEDNANYALTTQVVHGVGAGQLDYGPTGKVAAAIVGPNVDLIVTRTFVNSSGGTIAITEIGIYGQTTYTTGTRGWFCMIRDLLPSSVSVLNGQTLTVEYTLRTTV